MSNWSGFTLTNMGADLQAKINAGVTTLALTKIGLGSGSSSGSINALTQMLNKVQDVQISKITPNNNIVEVDFTLTNKGLNAAYKMSEMGIFATDPDEGEILFAYMTDSSPDTMPADGSATVVSLDVTLNITFSNTGNVSATIDTGAFVTHENLNTHNSTEDAHSAAFAAHNTDSSAHTAILNAIKAISGMSDYGIAPSKTIAAMIPLLGFGGIVAQRLEQNGFVKFANGLTLQWGNVSDVPKKYTCTFPTAFSVSPFAVMAMDVNIGNPLIFGIDTYSTTGFQIDGIRVNGTTNLWFRYIAIGV